MGNKESKSNSDNMAISGTAEGPKIITHDSDPISEAEMKATNHICHQTIREQTEDTVFMQDNSMFDYKYERCELPKDESGYVVSFAAHQDQEIRDFFDKYGCVVVRDCLSAEELARSLDEAWSFLYRHYGVTADDTSTWETKRWPELSRLGILGSSPVLSPQLCANRQNPVIHHVFATLFGTPELRVAIERLGMMRPTRDVPTKLEDGTTTELRDRPDWKTVSEWLHWDMNPFTGKTTTHGFTSDAESNLLNRGYHLRVQGMVALVDCGPHDGGFHAVPGFHNHLRGWANANQARFNPKELSSTMQVPKDDPIRHDVQTLPLRAGSLMIWHSALPHGTFPNDSAHGRLIQYVKMVPAADKSMRCWMPRSLLPKELQLTELGEKLYGYEDW